MHLITLVHETDFDGWRRAARALVLNGVPPSEVTWRVRGAGEAADAIALEAPDDSFRVPAKFVELARLAILHRAPNRFALLYRLATEAKDVQLRRERQRPEFLAALAQSRANAIQATRAANPGGKQPDWPEGDRLFFDLDEAAPNAPQ